jgi:hypothetical protein
MLRRIKRAPRLYFLVQNYYYRFMGVFSRRRSLFLNLISKHNFIKVALVKILQGLAKHIQGTQVEGVNPLMESTYG